MAQKIEYCNLCKADFKDKTNWCSKCHDRKPFNRRKKKQKDENQLEMIK